MTYQSYDIPKLFHTKVLTYWSFDILKIWHNEVMTFQSSDILKFWHTKVLTFQSSYITYQSYEILHVSYLSYLVSDGLSTLKLQITHDALMPSNILCCIRYIRTFKLSEWLTFNPKATACRWCPDAFKDNNILIWITTHKNNKTRITELLTFITYQLTDFQTWRLRCYRI